MRNAHRKRSAEKPRLTMKKLLSVTLIILLLTGVALAAAGCVFNDGSLDEVKGIYGIESCWYRDVNGVTHNYADTYDYYLIVMYGEEAEGENTYRGKIYLKPVNGEESANDITYTVNYGSDSVTVESISISGISAENSFRNGGAAVDSTSSNVRTLFSFYPKREDIVYKSNSLTKNSQGTIVTVKSHLQFGKMYGSITDERIEKSKSKQTSDRTSRSRTTEDE